MVEELTKAEALQKCRDMWNEIADKTEKENRCMTKSEYFMHNGISGDDIPVVECYCCEYALQTTDDCFNCPLSFPKNGDGRPDCELKSSPYYLWREACYSGDWEMAAHYARQIANLPENPDCK